MGERITWIVGHERSVGRANELDLTVYFLDNFLCIFKTLDSCLFC